MKRALVILLLGWITVAGTVSAFEGEGAFYSFLESHPQIKKDLKANPNLANDPAYLQAHPQFEQFYHNHGEVRGELKGNASDIMHREEWDMNHPQQERRDQARWKAGVSEQREEANTDRFMDSHPDVERKLEAHPNLANDPAFLNSHPGLQRFEETHPGVTQQLRERPRKFMSQEEQYDKNH